MNDASEKKKAASRGAKRKNRWRQLSILVLLVGVLLLIMAFIRDCYRNSVLTEPVKTGENIPVDTDTAMTSAVDTASVDSSALVDSSEGPDTTVTKPETTVTRKAAVVQDTPRIRKPDTVAFTDTLPEDTIPAADTIMAQPDSCSEDTTELWVYPDPSGGLHYSRLKVQFIANRAAKIQYRTAEDAVWKVFDGTPVSIGKTTTLYYDAIDSCGKVMEQRSEYYEIRVVDGEGCDSSMLPVKVGGMHFCIDRYEWPNRKGERPSAFVSYYQAGDSCYSVGKRLCSAEEWAMACSGPYSYKYPYGQRYERYGCITLDTVVSPSGSKPECRSYYGAYDMSGNLLEWTSTRASENSTFFYVMGGFWESGPKSGCFDKRYSYYPQNQHNPVGFRCCRDFSGDTGASGKGAGR